MVERIEDTIRKYYGVVVSIVGLVVTVIVAIYGVTKPIMDDVSELKADIRELRASVAANAARQEESRIRTEREFERVWEITRRIEARQNADDRQ